MSPGSRRLGSFTSLVVAAGALSAVGVGAATPARAEAPLCQGQVPTIVATEYGQRLRGTNGPDVISVAGFAQVHVEALGGDDLVCTEVWSEARVDGGAGTDTIVDTAGATSNRSSWPTQVRGGAGDDRIVGGPGTETTADYTDAETGVTIDLGAGVASIGVERDTLVGIYAAWGSRHADRLIGSDGDDIYDTSNRATAQPAAEWDRVDTRGGDDQVTGGNAVIDLGAGDDAADVMHATVRGGSGSDDINIGAQGTAHGGTGNDQLTSRSDFDAYQTQRVKVRLYGGSGNDTMEVANAWGRAGFGECPEICAYARLDGGAGRDTLRLASEKAVTDLAAGTVSGPRGRSRVRSFVIVRGTSGDDVIRGDRHRNRIFGGRGDDVISGRGGRDVLIGGRGRDRVDGGRGRDRCQAEIRRSC